MAQQSFYQRHGKRWLDLALTIPAIIILAPLFLLLYVAVRWRLGQPALFRQQRPGWREIPFTLMKYRTMTDERDANGVLLSDSERLTRFGRFLRATSLDELPELWNIIRGDMSLVGPRPLLMQYLPYYSHIERRRFELRPGLTGWAQINGRNEVAWNRRLALDVWYVEHCSLALDLRIIAQTLLKALRRDDVRVDTSTAETYLDQERRDSIPAAASEVHEVHA